MAGAVRTAPQTPARRQTPARLGFRGGRGPPSCRSRGAGRFGIGRPRDPRPPRGPSGPVRRRRTGLFLDLPVRGGLREPLELGPEPTGRPAARRRDPRELRGDPPRRGTRFEGIREGGEEAALDRLDESAPRPLDPRDPQSSQGTWGLGRQRPLLEFRRERLSVRSRQSVQDPGAVVLPARPLGAGTLLPHSGSEGVRPRPERRCTAARDRSSGAGGHGLLLHGLDRGGGAHARSGRRRRRGAAPHGLPRHLPRAARARVGREGRDRASRASLRLGGRRGGRESAQASRGSRHPSERASERRGRGSRSR